MIHPSTHTQCHQLVNIQGAQSVNTDYRTNHKIAHPQQTAVAIHNCQYQTNTIYCKNHKIGHQSKSDTCATKISAWNYKRLELQSVYHLIRRLALACWDIIHDFFCYQSLFFLFLIFSNFLSRNQFLSRSGPTFCLARLGPNIYKGHQQTTL